MDDKSASLAPAISVNSTSTSSSSTATSNSMLNRRIKKRYSAEEKETPKKKWYKKPSNWLRIFIILILLTSVITVLFEGKAAINVASKFLLWVADNFWLGLISFIGLLVVCTVFMVPGSLLTLGAGYVYAHIFGPLFGVLISSIVVFVGAFIGATLAFLNGRYLLRNTFQEYARNHPKFQYIDAIVEKSGFKVVFLLRLSPITPYNLFNYFMGITACSLIDYCKGHFGMIPDIILFCWVGSSIASIAKISQVGITNNLTLLIVTIFGTVIALIGVIYVTCMAKKQITNIARTHSLEPETELTNAISTASGRGGDLL